MILVREAPVEGEESLKIDYELFPLRAVEAEERDHVVSKAAELGIPRDNREGRIPGHQPDQEIVQADDPEDRDAGVHDPSGYDPQVFARRGPLSDMPDSRLPATSGRMRPSCSEPLARLFRIAAASLQGEVDASDQEDGDRDNNRPRNQQQH